MIHALKLGFSYQITGRYYYPRKNLSLNYEQKITFSLTFNFCSFRAVSCSIPKFNSPHCLNLRMAPKRNRSGTLASAAEDSGKKTEIDEPKLQKKASKTSNGEGEVVEDEPVMFEKMTVQEIKSRLRSNGLPVKGAKHELLSALKSFMSSKTDGEESSAKSSKDSVEVISTMSKAEQELIVESTETEGKKSTQVKKKVSSKITTTKVKASVNVGLSADEPWTVLTHKKPQKWWTGYDPKTMRPPPIDADTPHVKLLSWNVNGLRALLKLESFSALELAQRENFDVLCLQETKIQLKDVEAIREALLEGYDNSYWTCSVSKLGYSGTAIISRIKPLSVTYGLGISDHDSEGRLVTVEFDNFYLLSCYVPNSGDGLRRLPYRISEWDPSLGNYIKNLEQLKPVILTGDLNCAHEEIDIFNPAGNKRSAGFTEEERKSFETNFLDRGMVDTFRRQHPNVVAYSYWGYRHGGRQTNKGWRLDYFLASEAIADRVHDSYILPDVGGSDHCPIGLVLKL